MLEQLSPLLAAAGRAGLALLFILGGLNKLTSFGEVAARMEGVGIAPAALFLPLTILLEIGAGALLALGPMIAGGRYAPSAALALAVFTIATNVFFHRFWEIEGDLKALELSLFFKNVAIAGALVFAAATLAGGDRAH